MTDEQKQDQHRQHEEEIISIQFPRREWRQISYDLHFAKTRTAYRHAIEIRKQIETQEETPR